MERKLLPRLKFSANRTLYLQIFEFLRQQIIEKKIKPGTRLSENDLAAHFEVSRHPVREALNRLSNIGLIEIIPQKGTFVTKISVKDIIEICFIRCAIESQSIRNIVNLEDKFFNKILLSMKKNLAQQKQLIDKPQEQQTKFLVIDDAFHNMISEFSQTELAWVVMENLKANIDRIRYLAIGRFSSVAHTYDSHLRIYEAIAEKDYDKACDLIKEHTYEITQTYRPIREANQEWFLEEP